MRLRDPLTLKVLRRRSSGSLLLCGARGADRVQDFFHVVQPPTVRTLTANCSNALRWQKGQPLLFFSLPSASDMVVEGRLYTDPCELSAPPRFTAAWRSILNVKWFLISESKTQSTQLPAKIKHVFASHKASEYRDTALSGQSHTSESVGSSKAYPRLFRRSRTATTEPTFHFFLHVRFASDDVTTCYKSDVKCSAKFSAGNTRVL